MSKRSLARLPTHIGSLVTLYEKAVLRFAAYSNPAVHSFLKQTSREYEEFQNYKLRTNSFNPNDFPLLVGSSVGKLFDSPLKLSNREELTTDELFRPEYRTPLDPESIHSSYNRTTKRTTDYTARIITALASYFRPLKHVPPTTAFQNSYNWYHRLVHNTPVVLVLRQQHRLFSGASLMQINKPYVDLKRDVNRIGNRIRHQEQVVRSYHLTDLASIDLFTLALGKQRPSLNPDKLVQLLFARDQINIIDAAGSRVSDSELKAYLDKQGLSKIIRELNKYDMDNESMQDIFPYDLVYPQYHLLTIEAEVLQHDHTELLDVVEASELELVAARIGLGQSQVAAFFNELPPRDRAGAAVDYSQLLAMAHATPSPIHELMKRLGASGLLEVDETAQGIHLQKKE